ncbi:MAG: hypothetical protein KF718_29015 [Polyangiaceae bacterium]|nr:hypothetical protein [Polyangiaceae bacterium]
MQDVVDFIARFIDAEWEFLSRIEPGPADELRIEGALADFFVTEPEQARLLFVRRVPGGDPTGLIGRSALTLASRRSYRDVLARRCCFQIKEYRESRIERLQLSEQPLFRAYLSGALRFELRGVPQAPPGYAVNLFVARVRGELKIVSYYTLLEEGVAGVPREWPRFVDGGLTWLFGEGLALESLGTLAAVTKLQPPADTRGAGHEYHRDAPTTLDGHFDGVDLSRISDWDAFFSDQLRHGTHRRALDGAPSDWLHGLWQEVPATRPELSGYLTRLGELRGPESFLEALRLIDTIGVEALKLDLRRFAELLDEHFDRLPPRSKFGHPYVYDHDLLRFIAGQRTRAADQLREKLQQTIDALAKSG